VSGFPVFLGSEFQTVAALLSALCSVLLPGLQAADIPSKFTTLDLFISDKFHSFVYLTRIRHTSNRRV